jgi:hypothetical protein
VYDTDFLEKNCIYLSDEERLVVLATVVGQHNAIFYGHEPERLIKAIKMLTSNYPFVEATNLLVAEVEEDLRKATDGILYMKDFDSWGIITQQFFYPYSINDKNRDCQFIATATENPFDTVVPDMINNFDIIYECKNDYKAQHKKWHLNSSFRDIVEYHDSLKSGHYVTSKELEVDGYWLRTDAFLYLTELTKINPVTARKVAMVSRSITDCNFDSITGIDEIRHAEKLVGVCK